MTITLTKCQDSEWKDIEPACYGIQTNYDLLVITQSELNELYELLGKYVTV